MRDERRRRPNPLIGIDGFNSQVERDPRGTMFARPDHITSVQYEVMQRALGQRPFGRRRPSN